jgi:pyruvate dehydrogenase E1 component alpha subunit
MPGVTVDGQDVMEMYEVAGEAVARARRGEGPTLIEAQTYRYFGHYGADNPLGYRTEEEEAYYKGRDCILTMGKFLLESGTMNQDQLDSIDADAIAKVEAASKFAMESPYPDPSALLTDVYVKYP